MGASLRQRALKPTHKTHKVTRRIHSPTCHLPKSAYPGNPFPSSSLSGKSMNTEGHLRRQVRISLSKLHNAIKPTANHSTQCAHPTDLNLIPSYQYTGSKSSTRSESELIFLINIVLNIQQYCLTNGFCFSECVQF